MSPYQLERRGLSVTAYVGDGSVLLAFNLDEADTKNLAGFAIKAVTPRKGPYPTNEYWLKNRLSFKELTSEDKINFKTRPTSNTAPFQSFHWIHFPGAGPGQYRYTVYPCYFTNNGPLDMGPEASLNIDLSYRSFPGVDVGFTRGVISSQAYAERFKNAEIRPREKTMDFDTAPYQRQYEWLGGHARELVFGFLDECLENPSLTLDVFTYDFDEPDVIKKIVAMGSRARVIQDDSALHTKGGAVEPDAVDALKKAGVTVKTGHFRRYSHDKVLIQKTGGKATKVLTGAANFSVRGLYVQANSVLVFDDPQVAGLYGRAFDQAFDDMGGFRSSDIASRWFDMENTSSPVSFSFAPHETAFTLDQVAEAIKSAKSSVLFAVMEANTRAKGPVLPALMELGGREGLFSLGIVDTRSSLALFKKGTSSGVTSKGWIRKNAPAQFQPELSGLDPTSAGGAFPGHVIHHKFVVCDFNDAYPVVYCGSSNMAEGGETNNGDNLIAIHNPAVAYNYAVEAIRLYDHYRFRSLHESSTSHKPLMLETSDRWVDPYYNPKSIKYYERQLFSLSGARKPAPAPAGAHA